MVLHLKKLKVSKKKDIFTRVLLIIKISKTLVHVLFIIRVDKTMAFLFPSEDLLKFIFKFINPDDPEAPYSFTVHVDEITGVYSGLCLLFIMLCCLIEVGKYCS